MHYPAQGRLVGCLNDDISLVDENSGTYEVQTWECSDPEDCSSTEEHWQLYDKSDPESDVYLSNNVDDHTHEASDQSEIYSDDENHSFDGNDDPSDSEPENYSDEGVTDLDPESESFDSGNDSRDDSYGSDESY
jgi:hypothetical protein